MDTTEKIFLDNLNQDSVSVKKQTFVQVNGIEYPIGQTHRKAYVNSEKGRLDVQSEVISPYKESIFGVWGDTPTIVEN